LQILQAGADYGLRPVVEGACRFVEERGLGTRARAIISRCFWSPEIVETPR
jgi:hypothetical protein